MRHHAALSKRSAHSALPGLVEPVPADMLALIARELGATLTEEEPVEAACAAGVSTSPGLSALCAISSREQGNFELLTLRIPNDGFASYPQIHISVSGVERFLAHIDAARSRGGFQLLVDATGRAQDRLNAAAAGVSDTRSLRWLDRVRSQAHYLSGRLEVRPVLARYEPGEDGDESSEPDQPPGVLNTFAGMALQLSRTAPPKPKGQRTLLRTASSLARDVDPWQLLTDAWSRNAADEYRARVRSILDRAGLGESAAAREAVAEYTAAAMGEVTSRAAHCALICMDTAGLKDSIPVPMPIETDVSIPFTFAR